MTQPQPTPKRLLLVEDDEMVRETTLDLLTLAGVQAQSVAGGYAAAEHLEKNAFDIVLTDLAMPEGDGLWLARWIRRNPRCAQVIVVMMSAHVQNAHREIGMEAGAHYYLTKPFLPERFIEFIAKL